MSADKNFQEVAAESRLSVKGQTTIPGAVRKRLGLEPGDVICYETALDGTIRIRKARRKEHHWAKALEATLTEWQGETDDDL